jgi:integrase|tara:strand:+ start:20350 stop:20649 length:300 start_codon:yes stop_codon:yes gene_type:complete
MPGGAALRQTQGGEPVSAGHVTPDEYRRILDAVPDKYRLMVQVAVETGLRWGELIALRPRHLDFTHATLTVEETIVEVPKRASTTGQRMIVKPYPKDNE